MSRATACTRSVSAALGAGTQNVLVRAYDLGGRESSAISPLEVYEGPPAGVGASYTWVGSGEVGEGRMTIVESRPSDLIQVKLEFVKPFAGTSVAEFTFKPEGDRTLAAEIVGTARRVAMANVGIPSLQAGADHAHGLIAADPTSLDRAARTHIRPWAIASAREDLGVCLADASDPAAHDVFPEAQVGYRRLGATRDVDRIERRLGRLDDQVDDLRVVTETLRGPAAFPSANGVVANGHVKEVSIAPETAYVQGKSLLHHGPADAQRRVYSETIYPRIHLGWSELRSLEGSEYHYIEAPKPELYDMPKDPAETRNILSQERRQYASMRQVRFRATRSQR